MMSEIFEVTCGLIRRMALSAASLVIPSRARRTALTKVELAGTVLADHQRVPIGNGNAAHEKELASYDEDTRHVLPVFVETIVMVGSGYGDVLGQIVVRWCSPPGSSAAPLIRTEYHLARRCGSSPHAGEAWAYEFRTISSVWGRQELGCSAGRRAEKLSLA